MQDAHTNFDIAVLHIGINPILNLGSTAETFSSNILHIANQCKKYGVNELSILSVTRTTLLNSDLISDLNNIVRNKCQISGYHFIDINTITKEKLWKDGLDVTNSGKGVTNNFAVFK